jgi:hypothetical protein
VVTVDGTQAGYIERAAVGKRYVGITRRKSEIPQQQKRVHLIERLDINYSAGGVRALRDLLRQNNEGKQNQRRNTV